MTVMMCVMPWDVGIEQCLHMSKKHIGIAAE